MTGEAVFRAGQLATPLGKSPMSGEQMSELLVIDDAGLAVKDGMIRAVGRFSEVRRRARGRTVDLGDSLVIPGLVDSHSHVLFAGSREGELGMKLSGSSYMDILASGGGILSTVSKTRHASRRLLAASASERVKSMMLGGVTAVEAKSGYGLNLRDELKMLRAAGDISCGSRIVPTYLGAHALPPDVGREEYVSEIVEKHLPAVRRQSLSAFCDIFVEKGAFTLDEARFILGRAKSMGFAVTAHIDEFSDTGGSVLSGELGALSLSHLAHTPRSEFAGIAAAGTVGIILPTTPLFSMSSRYPDAHGMVSEGMAVAIGSDLSPNSWNESLLLSCLLSVYSCGLKQEEAVTAATLNSACAIGIGSEAGSLERGKRADFVCLGVDSYRKLFYRHSPGQVLSVYVGGKKAA